MRGGDKIRFVLTNIARVNSGGKKVQVGILKGSIYPDGTPVAMVAAVQEYGSPSRGIPSRPFMRNTVAEHSSEWPVDIGNFIKINNYDAQQTLKDMGELIVGQLKDMIREGDFVPLAPSTVARKGSSVILIETERLIDSFAYKVE